MLAMREQMTEKYKGKDVMWKEITDRYGTMPYEPTSFSYW